MEKKMENEMETGIMGRLYGFDYSSYEREPQKIRAPDPQGNIRILHWADPYEHEILPRVIYGEWKGNRKLLFRV